MDKAWGKKRYTSPSFRYFNNQAKNSLAEMLVTGSEDRLKKGALRLTFRGHFCFTVFTGFLYSLEHPPCMSFT